MHQVIILSLFLAIAFALAPLYSVKENRIDDSYIVVFKDSVLPSSVLMHQESLLKMDPSHKITFNYNITLNGFSGKFTKDGIKFLLNSEDVEFVEEDQILSIGDIRACVSQSGAPWGLGRISTAGRPTNSAVYRYDNSYPGAGVRSYVIDTGILTTHSQFEGRAQWGTSTITGESNTDLNGHGTHVAGTIAGRDYGVAKGATVVAVKVLGANGSGSTAGIVSGIDWVAARATANKDTANLSLGGGASTALDTAVNNLVTRSGVFTAVAAGNSNANACNYSPARATSVFTVGAITQPAFGVTNDPRASFSNYGSCLQIFAPGESILSAWIGSNTATRTISGTSMASPHVAGVASLITGRQSSSPTTVSNTIIGAASAGTVTNIDSSSPNRVLYSGC
jgi:subtilisin family serine protease